MGFKENLKDEISYQGLMIKEVEAKAGLSTGTMSNYLKLRCRRALRTSAIASYFASQSTPAAVLQSLTL